LYKKLKVCFIEEETKGKFLRGIMRDPPVAIAASKVAELEDLVAQARQALIEQKQLTNTLSELVSEQLTTGVEARDQARAQAREITMLWKDIDMMVSWLVSHVDGNLHCS
jgi:hypothetical protein